MFFPRLRAQGRGKGNTSRKAMTRKPKTEHTAVANKQQLQLQIESFTFCESRHAPCSKDAQHERVWTRHTKNKHAEGCNAFWRAMIRHPPAKVLEMGRMQINTRDVQRK